MQVEQLLFLIRNYWIPKRFLNQINQTEKKNVALISFQKTQHIEYMGDCPSTDEICNWNTPTLQKVKTDKQSDPESQPDPVPI